MAKTGSTSILLSARELARDAITEDEFIRRVDSWLPTPPAPIAATEIIPARSKESEGAAPRRKSNGFISSPIAAQTERETAHESDLRQQQKTLKRLP